MKVPGGVEGSGVGRSLEGVRVEGGVLAGGVLAGGRGVGEVFGARARVCGTGLAIQPMAKPRMRARTAVAAVAAMGFMFVECLRRGELLRWRLSCRVFRRLWSLRP